MPLTPSRSRSPAQAVVYSGSTEAKDCGTTIVYLVRHGEALHNLVDSDPDCFAKRRNVALKDPPLTEKGEGQAKSAAVKLQDLFAKHNDGEAGAIVSSTLRRALQTAELAALPRAAAGAPLIALDMAAEIQYDDIWNEPRSADAVAADWPEWRIEAGGLTSVPEATKRPLLECADAMITRAEAVWKRIAELRVPVVILVAHGGFFHFFQLRVSVANGDAITSQLSTGETRRCLLPPPDGRRMFWSEVGPLSQTKDRYDVAFWNRYSKLALAINRARCSGAGSDPVWAQKEWRDPEDSESETPSDIECLEQVQTSETPSTRSDIECLEQVRTSEASSEDSDN